MVEMPKEKIDNIAFITPDLVAIQLEPGVIEDNGGERGAYVYLAHVPASEQATPTSARWEERRGKWYVIAGTLSMQPDVSNNESQWESEILEYGKGKLQLNYLPFAAGGCRFRRIKEMPTPSGK
jgi:hypothetical protein